MIESTGAEADDTIAVVLAGGKGTRLDPLTRHICKPALPFGGAFRSIDFTLSNCANSGVRTIGVATQYKPAVLLSHLARAWRGAADDGPEVVAWRAEEQAPDTGYRGTADAVYRNLDRIRSDGARLVLVLAGDHVYKMDYRPMLEAHCARRADVEMRIAGEWQFGDERFDPGCMRLIREAAERLRVPHRDILSQAGHDAYYVSRVAPTAMIFTPCRDGISHNEAEHAERDYTSPGVNVLLHAVLARASR